MNSDLDNETTISAKTTDEDEPPFMDNSDYQTKTNENSLNSENNANSEVPPENDPNCINTDWLDILGSGGVKKKIIVEGKSGTRPTKNEKCTINYTCSLENDTIVESKNHFTFFLGESDVISGLDVSISLMDIGEKCLLKIQPRLAYGKKGLLPNIPINSTLTYEVELVAVEPADEIESLTIQQRQITGNKKREKGNFWYTREENTLALQCYRRALDYLDVENYDLLDSKEAQISDAELQSLLEDRISVYNNMAAAQIKMQLFDPALISLETVLRCQPNNLKAHFRKAKAYVGKNELHMAMKSLKKAEQLAPEDPEIRKEMNTLLKMMKNQNAIEKQVAKRMFIGINRKNTEENRQNNGKIKIWTTLVTVVAVGIAGFVVHRLKYS